MQFIVFLVAILALAGCSSKEKGKEWGAEGKIKVLSTTGMIHDLVKGVGGDRVEGIALIGTGLDPHSYELVKGDDEKLFEADLIFFNGLGLEHSPSIAQFLKESPKAIPIGEGIIAFGGEPVWVDGELDPHIWMDVSLWLKGAEVVAKELAAIDLEHGEEYFERATKLASQLRKVDQEIKEKIEGIPCERRYLVTSHDAFHYFARRYLGNDWQERVIAPEGLAPEGQLSSADIQNVVEYLTLKGVSVIFPESNLSRDSIKKIIDVGRKRNLEVKIANEPLYGDAMGERGSLGETYEGMMLHNGEVIARNLTGEYGS